MTKCNHDALFLITARGGSKGIPGKNIKLLNGKPLIQYSIDAARGLADDSDICVSTDNMEYYKIEPDKYKTMNIFKQSSVKKEITEL